MENAQIIIIGMVQVARVVLLLIRGVQVYAALPLPWEIFCQSI